MLKVQGIHDELMRKINTLCGVLEVHRCNGRPDMTVGECVKADLCRCSCGLLLT